MKWRHLLLERKTMMNWDGVLKSKDITLPTEACIIKAMVFPVAIYGCESWSIKKAEHQRVSTKELMLLNCAAGEDSWEPLGLKGDQTSQSERKSTLIFIGRTDAEGLATWCKELTHWKKPSCWERLKAKGERGNRGWDGWIAPLTQRTWIWWNFRRQWRTEEPGMLQSMALQRVRHDSATEQQQQWCGLNFLTYIKAYLFKLLHSCIILIDQLWVSDSTLKGFK